MKITDIYEDGGAFVGSSDIASSPSRMGGEVRRRNVSRSGDLDWHNSVNDQRRADGSHIPEKRLPADVAARQGENLAAAKAKMAKQSSFLGRLKSFLEQKQRNNFRISESFDMQDVISRLSSLEGEGDAGNSTVSFGIEDDEGNMMKITVRAEQSKEFEDALANELADAARRREVTGEKSSISMAELLLKLNDEFDIVDASFPTIPTDAVYNADKVQYGVADTAQEDIGGDNLDAFPEGDPMAGGDMGSDPMAGGPEGDMNADPMAGGPEGDMSGDASGEDDEFFDDGSVEDFPEDTAVEDPQENLLTAILKMLTADAESKKAEADAKAEEARAKQAEFSALAAKNAVAQQEEVVRMEAEMESKKAQEKDAKRIADIARFRVGKANSFSEGTKPTFGQFLVMEFEEFDTVSSLTRQRSTLRMKYAIQNGDDPDTIRYKREALQNANRELDAKIRHAQAAARYKDAMARKEKAAPKQAQPSMNPQQQAQAQAQAAQQGQAPGGQLLGGPNAL